jgi:hypothetical protein
MPIDPERIVAKVKVRDVAKLYDTWSAFIKRRPSFRTRPSMVAHRERTIRVWCFQAAVEMGIEEEKI